MKRTSYILLSALLLTGCGTADLPGSQTAGEEQVNTIEFPKLKQTVDEESRNSKVVPQEDIDGIDPEVLEMQGHEGFIAQEVMMEVFGSYEEMEQQTISLFRNESTDEYPMGFYIGMKEQDEKFDALFAALQKKVDDGEILAKYIHFYQIEYSQKELNDQLNTFYSKLDNSGIGRDRGNFGMSIDSISYAIQIDHNMFTEGDQQQVRDLFSGWDVEFTQTGEMVPGPGEPVVILPDEEFTTEPPTSGEVIMYVQDGEFHTQNMYYQFPEATELQVGMRVDIEVNGPVMESFPAQGAASFVTVHSNYKPAGATLSEFEVNAMAIGQLTEEQRSVHPLIKSTVYDETTGMWQVEMESDFEEVETYTIEIEDK